MRLNVVLCLVGSLALLGCVKGQGSADATELDTGIDVGQDIASDVPLPDIAPDIAAGDISADIAPPDAVGPDGNPEDVSPGCTDNGDCPLDEDRPCEAASCNQQTGDCEYADANLLCDDDESCTDDLCQDGVCSHPDKSGDCDDGDACTLDDKCAAGVCDSGADGCEPFKVVFRSGAVVMGSIGLEQADATCQAEAEAAKFNGTFRAWLGTSAMTAQQRLEAGGEITGGFVRSDGVAVAGSLSLFATGFLWHAVDRDANQAVRIFPAWSGETGVADLNCSDWTSGSGDSFGTPSLAASNGFATGVPSPVKCDLELSLICLQVDGSQDVPVPETETSFRPAFVSSVPWLPFSGAGSADAMCQADAMAEGLPAGRYVALLQTAATGLTSRLRQGNVPFARPDGVKIADDIAGLAVDDTLMLQTGISTYANGMPANVRLTTGVGISGAASTEESSCGGWRFGGGTHTATAASGVVGPAWNRGFEKVSCAGPPAFHVMCAMAAPAGAFNRVWVSSEVTGKMVDAGGLEGADEVCQTEGEGQFDVNGEYMALLNVDMASASARLEEAWSASKGFVNMRGLPVAETFGDLDQGKHWYQLAYTINGEPYDGEVWSNTSYAPGPTFDCEGWSASEGPEQGFGGEPSATGVIFHGSSLATCDVTRGLVCVQVDRVVTSVKPAPVKGREVFFTSQNVADCHRGLAYADDGCRALAVQDGRPPAHYKALLAAGDEGPIKRLTPQGPNWVRPDGVPVLADPIAWNKSKLVLDAAIGLDSTGAFSDSKVLVTVAAAPNLVTAPAIGGDENCNDWQAGGSTTCSDQVAGLAREGWSADATPQYSECAAQRRYCMADYLTNVVFMSSQALAGGVLAQSADQVCADDAAAASLAGTFVALRHREGVTPKMMLDGFGANAFVRPDYRTIAMTSTQLVAGDHVYPLNMMADGSAPVGPQARYWWGSQNKNCNDWGVTSSGETAQFGRGDRARPELQAEQLGCGVAMRFLCVQVDHHSPVELTNDEAFTGRVLFTSSTDWLPNPGGITDAHAHCQSLALAAGLGDNFGAVLALNGIPASTVAALNQPGTSIVRPDGRLVATDAPSFVNGQILAPPSLDETGALQPAQPFFGARDPQSTGTGTCGNWGNTTGTTILADTGTNNALWAGMGAPNISCDIARPLVCIQGTE